jgi:Flp pilus assembly pilin Flp
VIIADHAPCRFWRDESGATLLEYGMLSLLITALAIVAVTAIGAKVSNGFVLANAGLP